MHFSEDTIEIALEEGKMYHWLRSILKHEENSSMSEDNIKLQNLLEENGLNVNEPVRS